MRRKKRMEYIKLLRKYFKQFRDYRTREKELSRRILFAVTDEERGRYQKEAEEIASFIKAGFDIIGQTESIKERRIIELHYVDGKSWDEIAARVNYSYSYCTHLEDAALKRLSAQSSVKAVLDEFKNKCGI